MRRELISRFGCLYKRRMRTQLQQTFPVQSSQESRGKKNEINAHKFFGGGGGGGREVIDTLIIFFFFFLGWGNCLFFLREISNWLEKGRHLMAINLHVIIT